MVGQFEVMVPRVTGLVLKRIALWDCFGECCEKTGSKSSPNSPIVQFATSLAQSPAHT